MFRILVVEDDPDLNRTVCDFLGRSGYAATGCPGAEAAYDAMYETVFDLIVTDVMMPGIDGFEFAATVRSLNENIPILFMTAREDFASRQRGYRVGADDYMVKPVDLDEMFLRIGALLRRAKIASSRRLTVGSFVMDADERTAYLNGEEISLTNREFSLLFKLLSYPRKTFTRTQLMDEFWSVDTTSGPRAVMKNYAALLQDETLPPEQRREYAEAIEGTAIRMAALVSNILKLNKLENQQIFPQVRCFDLGEQLAECLLQFETAWEERELECSLAEDIQVEADPELLSLVWSNLISNAVKFTDRGGKITVELTADGDWAVVRVTDTGCGMTPETGRHIFEKFYQGDTAHATAGNGLGLALVKRVVDITGGVITVSSTLGKGSTFTVRLERGQHGADQ